MRLTLRTLLAYIDGILTPDDAQDLGKKIEESEVATDLVHRISDVMRRLRLGAPSLTGEGSELDPNTVSEYLDNTLAADQVADFEQVCLDSDTNLAEVAACHQVLTLVLGEPAEIDAKSREWMYQLQNVQTVAETPSQAEGPVTSVTTDLPAMPADAAEEPSPVVVGGPADDSLEYLKSRPKPMVPEYLRNRKSKNQTLPVVACLIVLAILAVATVYFTGQMPDLFGKRAAHDLAEATPRQPTTVASQQEQTTKEPAAQQETPAVPPTSANETQPSQAADATAAGQADAASGAPSTAAVAAAVKPGPSAPPVANPPMPAAVKATTGGPDAGMAKVAQSETPATQPVGAAAAEPAAPDATATSAAPGKTAASDKTHQETPAPVEPKSTALPTAPLAAIPAVAPSTVASVTPRNSLPGTPDAEDAKAKTDQAADAAKGPDKSGSNSSTEPLGLYMSTGQVLLKRPVEGDWKRVMPNEIVKPELLLVLPTYRARVSLTLGIALDILGGTQASLLGSGPQQLPGIRVDFGRVVMIPVAKAGTRLRVEFGERRGMLTFSDAESMAALEVRRLHQPGVDPETEPAHIAAELFAAAGALSWEEAGKAGSVRLTPATRLVFDAGATAGPLPAGEVPGWTTAESLRPWDRTASAPMEKGLQTEQTPRLGLLKMAEHPRKEIRLLALQSLGFINEFHSLVDTLNDPAYKAFWNDYVVDYLRNAVARGPETAKAMRLAMERQYPPQAQDLYRMLWGYTNKDLEAGADADLVKAIESSDSLPMRVLGAWNLNDITGKSSLLYRPEDNTAKRQQGAGRWRQRLEAKEIRFKTPDEKSRPAPTPDAAATETEDAADN